MVYFQDQESSQDYKKTLKIADMGIDFFYDQESNQEYKKVIKILHLGNDFLLGSRLQECVQELGFGCWFLYMIKKVTRLQESDQDLAFGY